MVGDGEATGQRVVAGDVGAVVEAERIPIVAGTGRREAVIALEAARGPAVRRHLATAAPIGIGLAGRVEEVLRHHVVTVGVRVPHLLTRADAELMAVRAPTGIHVRVIGRQPTEVVVEGTVLEHHDDDGVDRRVRGRMIHDAIGTQRAFGVTIAPVAGARAHERRERHRAHGGRGRAQEVAPVHPGFLPVARRRASGCTPMRGSEALPCAEPWEGRCATGSQSTGAAAVQISG